MHLNFWARPIMGVFELLPSSVPPDISDRDISHLYLYIPETLCD